MSNRTRYALLGALFGACFPIFATLLDAYIQGLEPTLTSIWVVQASQPLHWVIDTAPLFLGLFASLAGKHQDNVISLHADLQRESERTRNLARFPDENPSPVMRILADGSVAYANRPGTTLLNDLNVSTSIPDDWRVVVSESLESNQNREVEVDSMERTISLIFAPVPDGGYVNVYGRDITKRKKAEHDMRAARDAAEAANRAKSVFLANMSHEIRTPLNAIFGYAQLLEGETDLSRKQRRAISTIQQSGAHLLSIINDILEISKIEAGGEAFKPVVFDLQNMVRNLAGMFEIRCLEKDLDWRLIEDLMDAAENGPTATPVQGDDKKLRQVLINLLGNAIKFTESGRVILRVQAKGNERYSFEVSDTGPGIPAEHQKRIFEAFYQEDDGEKHGGTGLGLSISVGHVELMGGRLELESRPGEGSRFFFELHLPPGERRELADTRADWSKVRKLSPGCEVQALIVDDMATSRDILVQILQRIGAEAKPVVDGFQALEQVKNRRPDIVFMDIRMPGIDGEETRRRIVNQHGPHAMKFVAVTTSVFEHQRQRFIDEGFDGFIDKPIRAAQVFETLARTLDATFIFSAETLKEPEPAELPEMTIPSTLYHRLQEAVESHSVTDLRKGLEALERLGNDGEALAERLREPSHLYDMEAISGILEKIQHE